jgi:hypothetical protein
MKTNAEKQLLEYKKVQFLSYVERSADYQNVNIPKVKFWKGYDNHFKDGERAHIHIESNTICIAETELESMDEEDIKETASHEVSHLYDLNHGTRFQNKQIDTNASLWRPPAGTVGALSEEEYKKLSKERRTKKESIKINHNNCHICNKEKNLKECPYCEKYFCDKHIEAIEPGQNIFKKEYIHPCASYYDFLRKEEKERDEKFIKKLDEMKGKNQNKYFNEKYFKENHSFINKTGNKKKKRSNQPNLNIYPFNRIEEKKNEDYIKKTTKNNSKKIWIIIGIIISIIFFLLIISVFLNNSKVSEQEYTGPRCGDGTPFNSCSNDKPLYCYDGVLENKASECGCPEGYQKDFQSCVESESLIKTKPSDNNRSDIAITGHAVNVPETYEEPIDDSDPLYFSDDDGKYLITYRVDDDCFNMTKKLIDKSFENINEAMDGRFNFKKVESDENIIFYCHTDKYDKSGNYHYCDDEYCYTQSVEQTIGLSTGDLIDFKNVQVDLYSGGLDLVTIEHETLHSLGIREHSALGSSIMSPYSDTNEDKSIDKKTLNKLKELYP